MSIVSATMKVDKGALRAAHRIFSSVEELLREALQNAYRASADTVAVHIDTEPVRWEFSQRPLKKITISDNGTGMVSHEEFFTLGRNGWNPDITGVDPVEPAGWGAFSFLMEGVEKVRVTSYTEEGCWSVEYDQRHLDGVTPFDVDYNGHQGVGTHIEIWFVPGAHEIWSQRREVEEFQRIRWTYPMEISLNWHEIESPVSLHRWRSKSCAFGTLRWRKKDADLVTAIEWEHTKVGVYSLLDAIATLAEEDARWKAVKGYMDSLSWYFIVNPDSGLRPDLPARRKLIENQPLRDLAQWIVETLWEVLWGKIQQDIAALPDTVSLKPSSVDFVQGCVPKLLRDMTTTTSSGNALVDSVMRFAGYTRYEVWGHESHHEPIDWYSTEGKWSTNLHSPFVYYSKEQHHEVSEGVAATILALKMTGLGKSLPLVRGVTFGNERVAVGSYRESSDSILFTNAIKVIIDGEHYNLPWLIWDDNWSQYNAVEYARYENTDWFYDLMDTPPFIIQAMTPASFLYVAKENPVWLYPMCIQLANHKRLDTDAPYAMPDQLDGGEVTRMVLDEGKMLTMLRNEAMLRVGAFSESDLENLNELVASTDAMGMFATGYIECIADAGAGLSSTERFVTIKRYADMLERAWTGLKTALDTFDSSL